MPNNVAKTCVLRSRPPEVVEICQNMTADEYRRFRANGSSVYALFLGAGLSYAFIFIFQVILYYTPASYWYSLFFCWPQFPVVCCLVSLRRRHYGEDNGGCYVIRTCQQGKRLCT